MSAKPRGDVNNNVKFQDFLAFILSKSVHFLKRFNAKTRKCLRMVNNRRLWVNLYKNMVSRRASASPERKVAR